MANAKITATASLLPNNLAASQSGWLAGLHNSANTGGGKVFLYANNQSRDGPEVSQATSIRYLELAHGPVLCVSSTNGTQIYSEDCTTLLHFARTSDAARHHRGACVVGPLQHIAMGTSKGGLALVNAAAPGSYTALPDSNPAAPCAEVADLCFIDISGTVATAHDDGTLQIWTTSPTGPYVPTTIVPSQGQAPVRVAALDYRLMVAYATGHIRLFDAIEFNLQAELTAHARCLTAVDVREDRGQIASVGEDTVLNVWQLDSSSGAVLLQYSTHVTHKLLTGVMFTSTGAAVTAYDSDEIYQIAMG